jgi:Cyclic nucleotide-binding domain/FHA domain
MSSDPFVEVSAGQAIFRESDTGAEMYIIESGEVEIFRASSGSEPLASLGPGDFFGEMAVLEDQPRFASAIARTPARLLRIERAAFNDLLKQNVEIAVRIMRKLVIRQRRTDQRLGAALAEVARLQQVSAPAGAEPVAVRAAAGDGRNREATPPAAAAAPGAALPPKQKSAAPAVEKSPPPVAKLEAHLRHVASNQTIALDPRRGDFMVGRPDPVTGIEPEINLGPLDQGRSLSRRHAKILRDGAQFSLREEVGTTNGTFVNGQRITTGASVPLKTGDKLRFGSIEVEFVLA